jgi:hypothetical protein
MTHPTTSCVLQSLFQLLHLSLQSLLAALCQRVDMRLGLHAPRVGGEQERVFGLPHMPHAWRHVGYHHSLRVASQSVLQQVGELAVPVGDMRQPLLHTPPAPSQKMLQVWLGSAAVNMFQTMKEQKTSRALQ